MPRTTSRFRIAMAGIAALAVVATAPAVSAMGSDDAARQSRQPSRSIVGTWMVAFTGEGDPTTHTQYTFHADGTMSESDTQVSFPTPLGSLVFSDGVGEWRRTGDNSYVVEYQKMGKPDGANELTLLTQSVVELQYDRRADTVSGTLTINVYDGEGNFLFVADDQGGPATGRRTPFVTHAEPVTQPIP